MGPGIDTKMIYNDTTIIYNDKATGCVAAVLLYYCF